MSSPQPPDGGQQGQQPQGSGDPTANANTPDPGADSTQMISSTMTPQEGGDQSSGSSGGDSTQFVRPATPQQGQQGQQGGQQGGEQGGDSTTVVPQSMQPPQPMYEQPGLSGQNQPAQPPQPPQAGGHPQQPPQAGAPGGGFQPPQAQGGGFGAPPPQPGQPQLGQPQPGQPGFGGPPPGGPPPGAPPGQPVEWGKRAISFLIDFIAPIVIAYLFVFIGAFTSGVVLGIGLFLMLVAAAFVIWNSGYKQGTTGQSLGRGVAQTRLISEDTGQPVGFGQAFLRQIVHALDGLPCYVGFLAPLWDEKNQTWADKIMRTVVVPAPAGPQGPGQFPQQPPQGPPSGGFAQPGQPLQQPPQGPPSGGFAQPGQPPQQPPQHPPQPGQPGQPPQW